MLGGAFILKKFISKLAKSGFYIVLFLCISAIGITAYVMNVAKDAANSVKESLNTGNVIEFPLPDKSEAVYDFGDELPVPTVKEESVQEEKKEPAPEKKPEPSVKETKPTVKEVPDTPTMASEPVREEAVYTMAIVGAVSEPFSGDEPIKSKTMGDWRIHSGVDIKAELGSEVKAIADGTVVSVESDTMMGHTIKVEHTGGLMSVYSNLAEEIKLKAGEKVRSGDVVGKVGESALSECLEEPHLHLEVIKDGTAIDPLSLFPAGEE